MTTERRELAEAITRLAFAQQKVQQAESTLVKANELYANLQEQAEELSSLDNDLATAKAASLKLALANGEAPLFEEPSGFAVPRLKKKRLDQQISGVADSLPVLQAELETAKLEAEEAAVAREHAAEAVIAKEAEQIAVDFMASLEALRRQHYVLASLMNRWVPRSRSEKAVGINGSPVRGVRQVKMPVVVNVAASQPILGDSEIKGGARVRDALTAAVANYWAALKEDGNTIFDVEKLANVCQPSPIVIPEVEFTEEEMKF